MFQTFQIWFLLENTHFRHLYAYNPPSPFHFCVYLCYKIVFCLSVWVCVLGGCCLHAPTPLHRTDRIESSQTGLEFKWFHTRCYWMSTKTFKTLVSHHPQPPHLPHFPTTSKIINSVTHFALGLYINHILNTMPAEPGALIKHMRTQICTFCQSGGGFFTEIRDHVSQFSWKHHRCKSRMTKLK